MVISNCLARSDDENFKTSIDLGRRRLEFYSALDSSDGHSYAYVKDNGSFDNNGMTGYETVRLQNGGISFCVYDTLLMKTPEEYTVIP